MLEEFLRRHDIDIALLQKVTSPRLNAIHYTSYVNIGTDQRETAILTKNGITITNMKPLPSGRGMAAVPGNLYHQYIRPFGAEKRDARERFHTNDIPLLPQTRSTLILVGGFNCVLSQEDTTGRKHYSRALDTLVRGIALTDARDATTRHIFTHYTPTGASRIDRTCISGT
jgi:hypothetical protein